MATIWRKIFVESCLAGAGRAGMGPGLFRSEMPNTSFAFRADGCREGANLPIDLSESDFSSSSLGFGGFNFPRRLPRAYLKHESARNAIRMELLGSTSNQHTTSGVDSPAQSIADIREEQNARITRYATTPAVRHKSAGVTKATLRLRAILYR